MNNNKLNNNDNNNNRIIVIGGWNKRDGELKHIINNEEKGGVDSPSWIPYCTIMCMHIAIFITITIIIFS